MNPVLDRSVHQHDRDRRKVITLKLHASELRKQERGGAVIISLLAVVFVIAVLAVAIMAFFGIGFFNRATADFRGKNEAIERTKADGDFRISAYNEFFDLCGSIQATEDRITIFEQRLETEQDTALRSEAQTNLDAVRAQRASLIREYNNKASRDFTEGQFRDRALPYHIDINQEETQCKL